MSNEINAAVGLGAFKSLITSVPIGRSFPFYLGDWYGRRYSEGTLLVATSATVVPLAGITQCGFAFFYNPTPLGSAVTITGAADNGSTLIRITAASHGLTTGQIVAVGGILGTLEANGIWTVTSISTSTFDLQGSLFTNTYVSGGTVQLANAINLRNGASGADFGQLLGGQPALIPLLPACVPEAVANVASSPLEYLILGR